MAGFHLFFYSFCSLGLQNRNKLALVLQNFSLFYPLVSEPLLKLALFSVSLLFTALEKDVMISLQLMLAGRGSLKVCLLSLITLCASARIKSCSFHPPVFHIFNCSAVCAFSLICFVCFRQLCCFRLSTVATGEWRGNKQTCARCL